MPPKLRPIDIRPMRSRGQPALLLRDPLALSNQTLVLPRRMGPLLGLLDGTRDEAAIRAALEVRVGLRLPPGALTSLLSQLDRALLLDNERSAKALGEALRAYRDAPCRVPVLAGQGYPAARGELERLLQAYIDSAPQSPPDLDLLGPIRGLVCPHIDFNRGGVVYAQVWRQAAQAVQEAELALILGTDHLAEDASITLTRQSYATPWGTLPTAQSVVEMVAQAVGERAAFEHELHHRTEHSVELAAVWLHFMRRGDDIPLVPVLCGSFAPLLEEGTLLEDLPHLAAAVDELQRATARSRTLVIAAGDLAHVGPAFGDSLPLDILGRARLRSSDEELMEVICSGDAEALLRQVKRQGSQRRICGLPPIYLALQLLGRVQGTVAGYAQCPADARGTSLVSVCGVLLH